MKSWKKFYQKELKSPNTLECECGNMLMGDSPSIMVVCENCWNKIREKYPEGFTCANCGEEVYDSSAIIKDHSAICANCA